MLHLATGAIELWTPPIHAGLAGTAMLVSAAWLSRRSLPSDRVKALAIGAGFVGLWIWDASRTGLGAWIVIASITPVTVAAALTAAELICRARLPAAPTAWATAAGVWMMLTAIRLLC